MAKSIDKFLGLRNTVRPERQPLGALVVADNVVLDDTGTLERRPGYSLSLALASITDAYQHKSNRYAMVLAGGSLYRFDGGSILLGSGYTEMAFAWSQVEDRIFFAGNSESGMVLNGQTLLPLRFPNPIPPTVAAMNGAMPAGQYQFCAIYRHVSSGMEGPASTAHTVTATTDCGFLLSTALPNGYEADIYVTAANDTVLRYLATTSNGSAFYDCDPTQLGAELDDEQDNATVLPTGITAVEVHESCLYAAVWQQDINTSFVYHSRPYFYHLFTADEDGFAVNGKCLGLLSVPQGLLIGTDVGIWLAGDGLVRLADYGVVPGKPFCNDAEGNAVFWTQRGLCQFKEGFVNLFDDKLSVAPGNACATSIIDLDGSKQAVVLTDSGGSSYNAY